MFLLDANLDPIRNMDDMDANGSGKGDILLDGIQGGTLDVVLVCMVRGSYGWAYVEVLDGCVLAALDDVILDGEKLAAR